MFKNILQRLVEPVWTAQRLRINWVGKTTEEFFEVLAPPFPHWVHRRLNYALNTYSSHTKCWRQHHHHHHHCQHHNTATSSERARLSIIMNTNRHTGFIVIRRTVLPSSAMKCADISYSIVTGNRYEAEAWVQASKQAANKQRKMSDFNKVQK